MQVDSATFCADAQLLNEPISTAWITFYRAMEGLPLNAEQQELFCKCAGREKYEARIYTEATAIVGRRGQKTSTALKFLLWKCVTDSFKSPSNKSAPPRPGAHAKVLWVPVIAQDTRTSTDILRTLASLISNSPILSQEVLEIRAHELFLKNGIAFVGLPASKASVRSRSCPFVFLDELAFVSIEGATDRELVRQVKPSMLEFGNARRLLKASTPWQSSGVIHEEFSQRNENHDILVWQASTQTMKPTIDPQDLAKEKAADELYYCREFLAEFVSDIQGFLPIGDITSATQSWRELPPTPGQHCVAALDASGLTGGDVFTYGVGTESAGNSTVLLLRGWRRAAVPQVCDEIKALRDLYGVRSIVADQYSFSFLAELMRQRDIELVQLPFTSRSKPEIYFGLKNSLAQGTMQLPAHPEALRELRALESVRLSGGGYKIGAPRGQHDDYATVLALLAHSLKEGANREPWVAYVSLYDSQDDDCPTGRGGWQKLG
jgi:hypothetical protein